MMDPFLTLVVGLHVATGAVGLLAFWVPVFARKGSPLHVRAGRVYEYCAYVVAISSITVSVGRMVTHQLSGATFAENPDLYTFPIFLSYLGLITFATVRHGVRVTQVRSRPEDLRTRFHVALSWSPIVGAVGLVVLALAAWSGASVLLIAFSPIGLALGWVVRREVRDPLAKLPRRGWFFGHLTAMLLGGIAFHSAFIVQQSLAFELTGLYAIWPWVTPSLVGLPAVVLWNRYYRRRFAPVVSPHG